MPLPTLLYILSLRVRNGNRQRQAVVAFLLLHGCADSRVHHHPNRAVERVQEKPDVLEQAHHMAAAVLLGQWLRLLLRLEKLVDVLLGAADV